MPRTVAIYNGDKNAIEESLVSVEEIDGVSGRRGEGGARGKVTASSMTTSEESENRLAMAVEFDHMYIGCSDSKASVGKDLEVQHLKDLLLLHLDLIQQQAEQLVAKDKQIKILRDENENLRAKLDRIDRRVSLSLHKKASESTATTETQSEHAIEDGTDPDLSFVKSEVEDTSAKPLSPSCARSTSNKVASSVKNSGSGSLSSKPGATASKPGSPLNKSTTPSAKQGTPSAKQASPPSKPGSPPSKPGSPSSKPISPGSKPGSPSSRLASPATKPGSPSSKPGSPPSKPGSPSSKPGTPPSKPGSPASKPGSPPSKPGSPSSKPASPSNKNALPGSKPGTPCKPGSPSNKVASPPTKAVSPCSKTGSPNSVTSTPGSKPSSPVSKNGSPGTKVVLPSNKLGTPNNKTTPGGIKSGSVSNKVESPCNKVEPLASKTGTPLNKTGKSDQVKKVIPKAATPKTSPRERRPRRDTAQSIASENESDLDLLLEPSKRDLTRSNDRKERSGQKRRSESESELPPKRLRTERERSESGNDATDHNLRSKSEKTKERPKDSVKREGSPIPVVDRPATPTSRAAALEAKKLRQKLLLKEQSSRGQPLGEIRGEPPMGRSVRGDGILNTSVTYYLPYGGIIQDPNPEEECLQAQVEIPRWGTRVLTSLYVMEGTENLEDEIFLKRHAKPEQDEKRRKRWDLQRMREQRHYERLRERYEGRQNASEPEVSVQGSLWPNPESALYLHVDDCLPVCAFGQPMARIPPEEFALPWLSGRCTDGVSTRRRKR
ncbi:male-specific lethal 1 homolog isoform X1 [Penaeus monodon]|uniref:male-specific lethal 1 homolog isoform X1 n=1 Tax=Penaeus monodon TaxID=6687 RepID=UPI0018A6FCA1|nr:male-specific lethal 1 homolog isoform X1 [Penaeus monodon]